MTDIKRHYELAYILKEQGTEPSILELLKKNKAEITSIGAAEKIRLSYEIKKEAEGFFGFVRFFALPNEAVQLDKELKFIKDILRFILVKADIIKEEPRYFSKENPGDKVGNEIQVKPELKIVPQSGALSNEELKAKLQEIS